MQKSPKSPKNPENLPEIHKSIILILQTGKTEAQEDWDFVLSHPLNQEYSISKLRPSLALFCGH